VCQADGVVVDFRNSDVHLAPIGRRASLREL
jgi:hypothetical protein